MNLTKIRTLLLFVILLSACSKPEDMYENQQGLNSVYRTDLSMAPGRELEDPYAIHNIIRAYNNLKERDSSIRVGQIKPNHVYLRFMPSNEKELELLKNDTTLILYDYPLNCEISEGEFTGDNSSLTPFTWQYCVVQSGKELPAIHYEVIYEVFIPPMEDTATKSTSGLADFYEALIDESARITGNFSDADTSVYQPEKSARKKWSPKGRIRVWDDLLNRYIPLTHVNVHARWFTHIETDLTDEEGYFQMKRFRYKVNYSIKWENSLFTIRNGLFFQAWYNGPKKKGDWILDIRGGKSEMFATMHRASYRLFYGDNLGMLRPTLKYGGRTKICYMDGNGTGRFIGDFSAGGIIPDIQIWGNGGRRPTNIIFGTLCHELGHQIHSQCVGNIKYIQTSRIIVESWAEAVEWAITNDEYNKLGRKYGIREAISYDHQYNKHTEWPFVYDRDYSPIFIDLVDKVNQREAKGPDYPNDLISQYTISFINNNLLKNSVDISSLRKEVTRHKMGDVDDFKINELFLLY